ncbi:MAG: SDR family NAD(P)-dependent oxidoreductase [Candidatus Promineifilaceae bacterium]
MTNTSNNYWHNRQALVTGAGGFIGSHLVEHLVTAGAAVRAFVRYNARADIGMLAQLPRETRSELEIVSGDLRDANAIHQAVADVDVVFHLGAIISIPYSYLHPVETVATNIMGTLNVLLACRAHNTPRLVQTSTSEVYGSALTVPMDESHPLQGQSPYSASKIGADKLVESFICSYNLPAVTVRPFNTYGPRQSARAVIPTIITQALTQETIHLGNLDTRRDFTYVADTVGGFLLAAQKEEGLGGVFNLGVGQDITIGELAEEIVDQIGRPVKIVSEAERLRPEKSEVMRLLSDNGRAARQLGWQPEVTFTEGIGRTIAWIRDHLDHYQIGTYEI